MKMASAIKTIVSKNKNRHKEGSFDLDLTYINGRVIAMGFPADNMEKVYRNSYDDVKKFLDTKHGNHYWIYNLCSEKERIYDKKKFDNRVTCYPFDDHHPPEFSSIQPFCDEVKKYLDSDDRNVAVVHCKAGKGRTGVMICCYLLHIKACKSAEDVLMYYGKKRTIDEKGVTIPSQRRYISYYDAMSLRGLDYKPVKLYLTDIVLDPMPSFVTASQCYIYFEVKQRGRTHPYESKCYVSRKGDRNVFLKVDPPLLLSEDVKFEFSTKPHLDQIFKSQSAKIIKWHKGDKVFHFWLNTFFVDIELDGSLAHDLTVRNPIENNHVHHASGSSEDSSEDFPLKASSSVHVSNGGGGGGGGGPGVKFAVDNNSSVVASCPASRQTSVLSHQSSNDSELTNLVKHASISDDHLLQDRKARQNDYEVSNSTHISSSGPLSSSSEHTADFATTTESFSQQRLRHSSVPQTARIPSALSHVSHVTETTAGGHHEAAKHQNQYYPHHRTHATITSNTSLHQNNASTPKVDIPGKKLSLRLSKPSIDKAVKDKSCKTFPENFSLTLFLVKPDDQSDNLIDYSGCPAALIRYANSDATASSAAVNNTVGPSMAYSSGGKQFTVEPVSNASSLAERPQRVRPLTGGSGASNSSATPSLKSMEQSSQDSSSSEDGVCDFIKTEDTEDGVRPSKCLAPASKKHLRPRATNDPVATALQPQSTWI